MTTDHDEELRQLARSLFPRDDEAPEERPEDRRTDAEKRLAYVRSLFRADD